MINMSGTLHNMNERELSALERATSKLRAKQPPVKPKRKNRPSDQIPKSRHGFTYWDEQSLKWKVYVKYKGVKVYCGKTRDQDNAPAMRDAKWNELAINDAAKEKAQDKQREAIRDMQNNLDD